MADIKLSSRSKKLLSEIQSPFANSECIPEEDFLVAQTINSSVSLKDQAYTQAALEASLLRDYKCHFKDKDPDAKEKKKSGNWRGKLKLAFLAVAGTIFFGCEGFDSMTALLGIFHLPMLVTFITGTVFSLFSILVFYGFDLMQISNHLGVKIKNAPKMLDLYLEQLTNARSLRRRIGSKVKGAELSELQHYLKMLQVLQERYKELREKGEDLDRLLNRVPLKVAQFVTAAVAGVLFFGGGYFAGQTVAMSVAGLFLASVTPMAWPVIAVSVLVGLAAFSIYWFVERPAVQNMIGRWMGLDKERIDELRDKKAAATDAEELDNTIHQVKDKIELIELKKSSPRPSAPIVIPLPASKSKTSIPSLKDSAENRFFPFAENDVDLSFSPELPVCTMSY